MQFAIAQLMALATVGAMLLGFAPAVGCNVSEEWQPLVGRQATAHALVIVNVSIGPVGQIRWNGVAIDRATLVRYLRASAAESPRAFLAVTIDRADCGDGHALLREIYRAYGCGTDLCGLQVG